MKTREFCPGILKYIHEVYTCSSLQECVKGGFFLPPRRLVSEGWGAGPSLGLYVDVLFLKALVTSVSSVCRNFRPSSALTSLCLSFPGDDQSLNLLLSDFLFPPRTGVAQLSLSFSWHLELGDPSHYFIHPVLSSF